MVVFPRICVDIQLVGEKHRSSYMFESVAEVRSFVEKLLADEELVYFFGLGWGWYKGKWVKVW